MEHAKVANIYVSLPAAAGAGTHLCMRLASTSRRKHVYFRLLLLIFTVWECSHLLITPVPHQHSNGVRHHSFPYMHRSKADSFKVYATQGYGSFPAVFYAVAENHVPSGPQLDHRLPMFFKDSPHVIFLLQAWRTEKSWSYILCCFATMLLAVISVLLKGFRRKLESLLQRKELNDLPGKHPQHTEELVQTTVASHSAAQAETSPIGTAQAATTNAPLTPGEAALLAHPPAGGARVVNEKLEDSSARDYKKEDAHRLEGRVGQGHKEDGCCTENVQSELQNNEERARCSPVEVQVLPHGERNGISSRGEQRQSSNMDDAKNTPSMKETNCVTWIRTMVQGFPVGSNSARAVVAFCNYSIDYVLMLLAMTFNTGIVLCLFAGVGLGFLLIGHHLLPPALETHLHSSRTDSHNSGSNAGDNDSKNISSNGCSRPLCRGSPVTKASRSTTHDAASRKHTQNEDNNASGNEFAENISGTPRRHLHTRPEDVYCCTYTGAGEVEEEEEEQQQGERRNKAKQYFYHGCENINMSIDKTRLPEGASLEKNSVPSFEWESASTTAVNTANALVVPALSELADAATAHDDNNGTHGAAEIFIQPCAPSGEELAEAETGSLAEGSVGVVREAKPLQVYLSARSDSNMTSTAQERSRSHEERRDGNVSARKIGPLHPICRGAEKAAATPASPTRRRQSEQEDVNYQTQQQQQQWSHQLEGAAKEFQRRPSDCYDILVGAEHTS